MTNLIRYCFLFVIFILGIQKSIFSQIPNFSKVPNVHAGDSVNITYLINNGVKLSRGSVIAWFPKDSISELRMKEITGMLNVGIREAEKFINAPLSWQTHQLTEPYTFYFRHDRFVSHASGAGFISIPFWRIKDGKAPWLHEVMHEMLLTNTGDWFDPDIPESEWSVKMPHWLFEGFPDYIALQVCLTKNLPWFDVFSNSDRTNVDSLFAEDVKSANGKQTLAFIGTMGVMPELSSKDRALYAPAFYHGSHSFVKYLVDNYGINMMLNSFSSFKRENETIERLTGKSLKTLKTEWLDKLKIAR